MARPLSLDLRERAVALVERGTHTRAEVAREFGIGERTLYEWLARKRTENTLAPRPHAGGKAPSIDASGRALLSSLVEEKNDRTLDEVASAYAARTGHRPSRSVVWRALDTLGLTRKKRR